MSEYRCLRKRCWGQHMWGNQ
ncbi:hypothetical protein [Mariprofundus sp. NF]